MSPQDVFGSVKPSVEFLQYGAPGREGLGNFLSAIISVLYIVAGIILIFMLLWGSLDWITSGGEKEKVAGARNKILHAIIGFVLMAITFAILGILGAFTGFEFFGQGTP